MTRAARASAGPIATWRPLAPFAVLFGLLLLFAVGGMLVIAYEADRSDAARAREAVTKTFSALQLRLDSAVEMNAAAPPIASALSGPRATPASAHGYLNFTSADALGYHGAIVLNHDGTAFAGTRFGLPWSGAPLAAAAQLVAPVAARLPAQGTRTVHALVRDGSHHPLAIAATNVVASARGDGRDKTAAPPRRLAMIAPVDRQLLPKMLPQLGVEDFRIAAAARDANAVSIAVENGAPVVFAWHPRTPGRAAIRRWAPAIGAMLVTALIMLSLAGRSNMRAIRALERLARRDPLTGLANRLAFAEELDRRLARGDLVTLGMLDLDGFKAVNDAHGHIVGDALLEAVAGALAGSASDGDVVARLGGDEFAWISASPTAADRFREEFARRIERPLAVGDTHVRIGASVGVEVATPGVAAAALMAAVDARLYESKRAARRKQDDRAALRTVEAHNRSAAA